LVLHVSFTDVPGHNALMSTMLNGTCVMDYAILVESTANAIMPAPQTIEHYNITKKAGIPTKLVCLNKVELENKTQKRAFNMIGNLRKFLTNYGDENVPIIPVSGTMNLNIDVLCQYISSLQIPKKNLTDDFKMLIIRSFNINTPKTEIVHLKGGVVGGSLARGNINIEQDVVIYPGYRSKKSEQAKNDSGVVWQYRPLKCKVISIKSDENMLSYAIPGGLIGIQLNIDPAMTGDDRLVGQVMFRADKPIDEFKIFEGIKVKYTKLDEKSKIKVDDQLQINVNSNNIKCTVFDMFNDDEVLLNLEKPICVEIGDNVTINIPTAIEGGINIFGQGNIIGGVECEMLNS
jgi:translation initiation factor 2 subunit 3